MDSRVDGNSISTISFFSGLLEPGVNRIIVSGVPILILFILFGSKANPFPVTFIFIVVRISFFFKKLYEKFLCLLFYVKSFHLSIYYLINKSLIFHIRQSGDVTLTKKEKDHAKNSTVFMV